MKLLEFEAKAILKQRGLPVPESQVVSSATEALTAAKQLGGALVLKAQIPIGGRMKAGGIHFADTPSAAQSVAETLLGSQIRGYQVERVLVEQKLTIAEEVFVSVTYDPALRQPIILATRAGGIEVEAEQSVIRVPFSMLTPTMDYLGRQAAARLGYTGRTVITLGRIIVELVQAFLDFDALLLEINPLVCDENGTWWIADVHLELDDDASYRQTALLESVPYSIQEANRRSDFERQAEAIDSADHRGVAGRLVPFDGTLGLLIGGGGASLTIFDALRQAGLDPANYCEIGGNPSVWKIQELTKLILSQPQVTRLAVIMNVVSNTRVDLVARGVIKGILQLGPDPAEVIVAFRIPGSWEDEGQQIMRHYGVPFYGRDTSIDEVVEAIKAHVHSR